MAKAILRGGGEEVKSFLRYTTVATERYALLVRGAGGRECFVLDGLGFVATYWHKETAMMRADSFAAANKVPRRRLKVVKVKLTAEML